MVNLNQYSFDENDKKHGLWSHYYSNGKLWYRTNYVHGIQHGLDEEYNDEGVLSYRGNYNMGRQIGYWDWFNQKHYYLCLI